jgi:hypothetical protein
MRARPLGTAPEGDQWFQADIAPPELVLFFLRRDL